MLLDKLACLWFAICVFCSQTLALTSCCCAVLQETAFPSRPLPLASMWVWPVRALVQGCWCLSLGISGSIWASSAVPGSIRQLLLRGSVTAEQVPPASSFAKLPSTESSRKATVSLCFSRNKGGCGYILCLISRLSHHSFIGFLAIPAPV